MKYYFATVPYTITENGKRCTSDDTLLNNYLSSYWGIHLGSGGVAPLVVVGASSSIYNKLDLYIGLSLNDNGFGCWIHFWIDPNTNFTPSNPTNTLRFFNSSTLIYEELSSKGVPSENVVNYSEDTEFYLNNMCHGLYGLFYGLFQTPYKITTSTAGQEIILNSKKYRIAMINNPTYKVGHSTKYPMILVAEYNI